MHLKFSRSTARRAARIVDPSRTSCTQAEKEVLDSSVCRTPIHVTVSRVTPHCASLDKHALHSATLCIACACFSGWCYCLGACRDHAHVQAEVLAPKGICCVRCSVVSSKRRGCRGARPVLCMHVVFGSMHVSLAAVGVAIKSITLKQMVVHP